MGLHPWELDRYTMGEFIARRKGMAAKDISYWHMARFVAYYSAAGFLKKGTKITDILPLPGENKKSGLKDLKGDDLKRWYEQRKEAERAAGIRND